MRGKRTCRAISYFKKEPLDSSYTVLLSLIGDKEAERNETGKIFCCYCLLILSRLFYLAFSANLGLLCMPHPGLGPLV